jgi:anti-anti-sigma regulatory factor
MASGAVSEGIFPAAKVHRGKEHTMNESILTTNENNRVTSVAITGAMTINNVGELRSGLLKAFDLGKEVELSLAEVTDLDMAGVQLICSAHLTSIFKDLDFKVSGRSTEAVCSVVEQSGILRHIGCAQHVENSCIWRQAI